MFLRRVNRLVAATVILILLLTAAPAFAAPGAASSERGPRAVGLQAVWEWLTHGGIPSLIKATLDEGSSIDPLGQPKATLNEGPGLDPHGQPKATLDAGSSIDPLGGH